MSAHADGQLAWVLEGLGQVCGLGTLRLDGQRQVVLDLEPGGMVLLLQDLSQTADEGLLVAVSGRCDWLTPDRARRLLAQADFRRHRTQTVRWMWNGGRLWASVRLSCAALQLGDLEQAIQRLCGEIDALTELV